MAYSELIKNFEKIRAYMREFYVYGFKSRTQYDAKSARSYDDERRRIESWLGDYMRFTQTAKGKNVFLSVDSRTIQSDPFYKAWKAKSFTDKDITLHFLLFDVLHASQVCLTLEQIVQQVDSRLCSFDRPMTFDESTVRKKLKEYAQEGIVRIEKQGRRVLYSRMEDTDIAPLADAIDFFSEAAPCGVVGSFLQDRLAPHQNLFTFKHHYITGTMDSDIMAQHFDAMHEKRFITAENFGKHARRPYRVRLVPLKIYTSAQNGRQYLIALHEKANRLNTYRLDHLCDVRMQEVYPKFDELRAVLQKIESHAWGVNCCWNLKHLEHVEFDVYVGEQERHIVQRLEREKRCGTVQQVDERHWRYSADVFDTSEMLPWIRTFVCRITRLYFSNKRAEAMFEGDLLEMYRMYGVQQEDGV